MRPMVVTAAGHAVAARDVLGAALGVEIIALEREVAQADGVEIVASVFAADQFHAGIQRLLEPEGLKVLGGHRQQQLDAVVGTDLGESAGRIAGRSHHQHPFLVLRRAGAHRESFGLLERTGGHSGADSRVVAVEGDVEILQSEVLGEPLALIGYGSGRAFQHAVDGEPVGVFVEPELGRADFEPSCGVTGPNERGGLAGAVLHHPAFVFERAARGDAFERIGSGCKIFHL